MVNDGVSCNDAAPVIAARSIHRQNKTPRNTAVHCSSERRESALTPETQAGFVKLRTEVNAKSLWIRCYFC